MCYFFCLAQTLNWCSREADRARCRSRGSVQGQFKKGEVLYPRSFATKWSFPIKFQRLWSRSPLFTGMQQLIVTIFACCPILIHICKIGVICTHKYFQTSCKGIQARLRRRGRDGRYTYTCTVRRPEKAGQIVEVKSSLSKKVCNENISNLTIKYNNLLQIITLHKLDFDYTFRNTKIYWCTPIPVIFQYSKHVVVFSFTTNSTNLIYTGTFPSS